MSATGYLADCRTVSWQLDKWMIGPQSRHRRAANLRQQATDAGQWTQDDGHGGTWRSWRDDKPQKAKRQSTNNSNNKGQKWTRQFRRHQQPPFQQSWKHRAPSTKHRAPITDRQDREVLQVLCRLPSPVSWCLCMNSIIWYQLVIVRCDWNVICKNAHILNVTHAGAPLAPTSSTQPSSHPIHPTNHHSIQTRHDISLTERELHECPFQRRKYWFCQVFLHFVNLFPLYKLILILLSI